jgi:anaerobic magnesium-protoporphyrin IX monomethyl ester cyclase
MTSSIAARGETLAPLMRAAGFRYVFLGIENILENDLAFLRAGAKNAARAGGRRVGNATLDAIDVLHRHGMYVVGGLIVGNPDDTRESIETNLAFARQYVDWPYIQHPTPYPGTPMTKDFRERNLIVNDRVEEYDGTTAVVRSEVLGADEIEFMRWRAERWMKLRHFWPVFAHSPGFVLRHGPAMVAHTFRGSSWRSLVGLEDERAAFARYKAIRAREREYLNLTNLQEETKKQDEGGRRAADGGQRAADGGQRAADGGQRAADGGQRLNAPQTPETLASAGLRPVRPPSGPHLRTAADSGARTTSAPAGHHTS